MFSVFFQPKKCLKMLFDLSTIFVFKRMDFTCLSSFCNCFFFCVSFSVSSYILMHSWCSSLFVPFHLEWVFCWCCSLSCFYVPQDIFDHSYIYRWLYKRVRFKYHHISLAAVDCSKFLNKLLAFLFSWFIEIKFIFEGSQPSFFSFCWYTWESLYLLLPFSLTTWL